MTENSLATIEKPALPSVQEMQVMALYAEHAAASGFLTSTAAKDNIAQRRADAFFIIAYGREMGMQPITALKTMFVLDSKVVASSAMILAQVRRYGVEVDLPDPATITDSATVRIRRPGGQWKSYTFTLAMAAKMGLTNKQNWQKQAPVMLLWRACNMGCRFEAGDIIHGLYPVEELAPDTLVDEEGDMVGRLVYDAPAQLQAPQTAAPSAHWSDDHVNRVTLVSRARQAGYIEAKDGWDELLKFAGVTPEQLPFINTRGDLGEIIKTVGDKLTTQSKQPNMRPAWFNDAVTYIWETDGEPAFDHFNARNHVVNALDEMLRLGELQPDWNDTQVIAAVKAKYPNGQRKTPKLDDEQIPF